MSQRLDMAVISVFPEMFKSLSEYGVVGKAVSDLAPVTFCHWAWCVAEDTPPEVSWDEGGSEANDSPASR